MRRSHGLSREMRLFVLVVVFLPFIVFVCSKKIKNNYCSASREHNLQKDLMEEVGEHPRPRVLKRLLRIKRHYGSGLDEWSETAESKCWFSDNHESVDYVYGRERGAQDESSFIWESGESAIYDNLIGQSSWCEFSHFFTHFPNRYGWTRLPNLGGDNYITKFNKTGCNAKIPRILYASSACEGTHGHSRTLTVKSRLPEELVDYCGTCQFGSKVDCGSRDDWKKPESLSIVGRYRAVIALESDICPSYFDEKILIPLTVDTIPIVWNATRYSGYMKLGSFVDLADPAVTPDHIRSLIENYDCSRHVETNYGNILYPSLLKQMCSFAEELYKNNNASSQLRDCASQRQKNFGCKLGVPELL